MSKRPGKTWKKDYARKAEAEFITASFASKVPLLALFWYSVSNTEFASTDRFTEEGLAVVISAIVVALAGVWYMYKKSAAKIDDKHLKRYHLYAGSALLAISVAMFAVVASDPSIKPNSTVVTTFSVWLQRGDTYLILQQSETLGGKIQLGFFPPIFATISAAQHLLSAHIYSDTLLFETFGGAWLWRIIDYAVSTGFIFVTNAFFFDSPLNIFTVLLVFSSYTLLMFTGYATETAWFAGLPRTVVLAPFVAGCIGFALTWVPIFLEVDATSRWSTDRGNEPVPWFVGVFLAWTIISFCIFPWITWRKVRHIVQQVPGKAELLEMTPLKANEFTWN